MTPRERDIEELKNKIEESESKLKMANQNGPLVVAVLGILLCLTLFYRFKCWFFCCRTDFDFVGGCMGIYQNTGTGKTKRVNLSQ